MDRETGGAGSHGGGCQTERILTHAAGGPEHSLGRDARAATAASTMTRRGGAGGRAFRRSCRGTHRLDRAPRWIPANACAIQHRGPAEHTRRRGIHLEAGSPGEPDGEHDAACGAQHRPQRYAPRPMPRGTGAANGCADAPRHKGTAHGPGPARPLEGPGTHPGDPAGGSEASSGPHSRWTLRPSRRPRNETSDAQAHGARTQHRTRASACDPQRQAAQPASQAEQNAAEATERKTNLGKGPAYAGYIVRSAGRARTSAQEHAENIGSASAALSGA